MSLVVTKVLKNTELRKRQEGKEGWRGRQRRRGGVLYFLQVFLRGSMLSQSLPHNKFTAVCVKTSLHYQIHWDA